MDENNVQEDFEVTKQAMKAYEAKLRGEMRRVDTHELLHVYSDHTANEIKFIKGEEDQYSRDELLSIISSAREEMEMFLDYWLEPAIAELDNSRAIIANTNDNGRE